VLAQAEPLSKYFFLAAAKLPEFKKIFFPTIFVPR
jgi:hypothetical protein